MQLKGKTVVQLAGEIEKGSLNPVELAQSCLDTIDNSPFGGRIFARTTPERAMAEAEAAADRAKRGMRRSKLDGVPVSWKDLYDTAGVATESGSRLLKGRVPEKDCEVLRRATEAGCVCVGKTHLSELAFSGLGVNPKTATPPNHHNETWAPGGSSSGAAASIAYGMAPVAIGSDTGGSVRIPAAWNSQVGLKTTAGLLPNDGVVPLCKSFDTVGPLAQTVEDAALMFEVLSGQSVDLNNAPSLASLRLLICDTMVLDDCAPEQTAAFEQSVDRLARAGVHVEHRSISAVDEATGLGPTLFPYEAYQQWGAQIEANPEVMFEPVRNRFFSGKGLTREQFDLAWADLERSRNLYGEITSGFDAVIMPATPILPPNVDKLLADLSYFWDANLMALRNTRVGNLLGLCALTIPTGHDACGFMICSKPNSEERLLQIGKSMEALILHG